MRMSQSSDNASMQDSNRCWCLYSQPQREYIDHPEFCIDASVDTVQRSLSLLINTERTAAMIYATIPTTVIELKFTWVTTIVNSFISFQKDMTRRCLLKPSENSHETLDSRYFNFCGLDMFEKHTSIFS